MRPRPYVVAWLATDDDGLAPAATARHELVGFSEGYELGMLLSDRVGSILGTIVGTQDGCNVGDKLGLDMGDKRKR